MVQPAGAEGGAGRLRAGARLHDRAPVRLGAVGEHPAGARQTLQGHRARQRRVPPADPDAASSKRKNRTSRVFRPSWRWSRSAAARSWKSRWWCGPPPRPSSATCTPSGFKSYRDLPVLINQWNSVVRWELRTKLFLRTLEFFWQEGHTAHATAGRGRSRNAADAGRLRRLCRERSGDPGHPGRKIDIENGSPGADQTYSIEAMMGDGKALQSGTSHNLGQNFAKAFRDSLPGSGATSCSTAGRLRGGFRRASSAPSSWCTATIRG